MRINDVPLDVEFPHYLKSVAATRREASQQTHRPRRLGDLQSAKGSWHRHTPPKPPALVKDLKEALPVSRRPPAKAPSFNVRARRSLADLVYPGNCRFKIAIAKTMIFSPQRASNKSLFT